ncbi:MAG: rRNA pseudouridine synthase [Lachnospiraceae bacterium]|nr:rRNA pseudouridine synthase [Lachnospiraceae bacterium]
MRLDKYLANALGLSRSQVKQYLKKNRITVNGNRVTDGAFQVAQSGDQVMCMDQTIVYEKYQYYMFYKPAGCVTARSDKEHRTVFDYVKEIPCKDLFAVGRLDKDTEGLLLLTNDGNLDHSLMSPQKHVQKTYYFEADGTLTDEKIRQLEEGVLIGADEPPTAPAILEQVTHTDGRVSGRIKITEGRYHQVKRMLHAVDCQITYLKRTAIGALQLDESLGGGAFRRLTEDELKLLAEGASNIADSNC